MFAGLVTKGIVITKLTDEEKLQLSKVKKIAPFIADEKAIKSWIQINLEANDLSNILPYVKKVTNERLNLRFDCVCSF